MRVSAPVSGGVRLVRLVRDEAHPVCEVCLSLEAPVALPRAGEVVRRDAGVAPYRAVEDAVAIPEEAVLPVAA